MTTWLLEAYGTDSRYPDDVRHRSYTTSRRRAEAFALIPKIQFTDSGHGIVFSADELPPRTRRKPPINGLLDYVREHINRQLAATRDRELAMEEEYEKINRGDYGGLSNE